MRDFGALPDSGEDASEALRKAVATIGKREIPTVLCFESGRYDFHAPEGQDDRVNGKTPRHSGFNNRRRWR